MCSHRVYCSRRRARGLPGGRRGLGLGDLSRLESGEMPSSYTGPVRLVLAGTPEPALPALRSLTDSPRHEVIAVLTRPDAASGRRGKPEPSPVARLALEQGIPVLRPQRPNTAEFVAELSQLAPDCCPVVAYGALLRDELLAVPAHGWVNLHFSLLPAWRGAAPVQAAIAAGDTVTGATTFQIE